jgi:RNA methyltransferase, TrmH family
MLTMKKIETITARDNRRLVHARKVRDGKAAGQIFIEGRRLVFEALRSDIEINECFVTEGFGDHELLKAVADSVEVVTAVSERIFDSITDTKQSQGIVLLAKRPEASLKSIEEGLRSSSLPIVVFLKEVNNPSNLGAVLRTAEAVGIAGVIVSNNSADIYSPKSIRAAMGAGFRMTVVEETDLTKAVSWAKEQGLTVTATDTSALDSYTETNWKKPRLLIFGSEAHGLDDDELSAVDERIKIPMATSVESLNLAVSAGIILFEARRQNS